ncbi:MAG: hypothetical protein Fur0010_03220 [Bdellovibrio sp.]
MQTAEAKFYKDLKKTKVFLHFEDGTTFEGSTNLDASDSRLQKGIWGEAAFTTGMSGYQETITDPSFLGQHIIFTTSHVGNYEEDKRVNQSQKCHATAIIARHFSYNNFLANLATPLIEISESRALVKFLTSGKAGHKSVISIEEKSPTKEQFQKASLLVNDLHRVSRTKAEVLIQGERPIVLIDYGCKQAIIDQIAAMKYPLVLVPYNATSEEVLSYNPRLIFLSNGPGDPRTFVDQITVVKELIQKDVPIRGICLGHQLLGLALGAEIIRLPFGQRGINHPCMDHVTGEIIITSQNHGYAIDEKSFQKILDNNTLKRFLYVHYTSLFDHSIEGIATTDHFLKSVQFHPEANPGPSDASIFFHEIKNFLDGKVTTPIDRKNLIPMVDVQKKLQKEIPYQKILIVGSGPIKIGQASEFDYSGTQACKALKELGVKVVLLNSNPATIMTDPEMAYKTYIEPITKETIKAIIEKENVDAVLSTMGGQTALNICVELEQEEYLSKKGVALLGARVDTINKTEDRELFAKELDKLGYQTGKRYACKNQNDALVTASSKCGYPLIIRRDFALGGRGSALVHNEAELQEVFNSDIKFPITLEKSLLGWKEIELEVMVDKEQNGVIICSIENVDPCGVHTGDSITVAPAQTISDRCYQQMRTMALKIAKHMGVVAGGANVQFAVNPVNEDDIVVIEMNPRVSRSSALASKATGYPIAKISAMLAVGFTLREILNDITKISPVAFEPTLDYVALKIPLFPFDKFPTSSQQLGPQMRSVGEVLALGSSFNEAFMKALRSLETGLEIPSLSQLKTTPPDLSKEYIIQRLQSNRELCLLTVLEALRLGISVNEIYRLSNITPWFIEQMNLIVEAENEIKNEDAILDSIERFTKYKRLGFSDKYLAFLTNKGQADILAYRTENNLFPIFRAVDTCSGEFNALTPYFYSTYGKFNEAKSLSEKGRSIAIMGSGPNRIGQGIEFDYSCVKSCQHLRTKNIQAIMINSNPETVSTDYDSSDRLYLSPLYSEDLYDIFVNENPEGIIACFSGQTGIKIREHIEKSFRKHFRTFKFLGSSMETLDLTEDRKLFSEITKKVDLAQTRSMEVRGHKNLVTAMTDIGMPVIIRPSYVIGGESMYIFHSHEDINELPTTLKEQLQTSTVTFQVENYLENALEYDVDLVRDAKGHCVFTVCEHIEYAGVHSGDSGMISPPVVLTKKLYQKMKAISEKMAEVLNVIGPINFQYAVKDGEIYCIEANPRGSRTLPFLSKAYNIPLPSIATDAMLGLEIQNWDRETSPYFAVKQSTFPFDRFLQDNIILGPKMRSTGETMGLDMDKEKAILKSYLGNYPNLMRPGKIMISLADRNKEVLLPYLKIFHSLGMSFIGTSGTCDYIKKQGVPCEKVAKIGEDGLTIVEALKDPNMIMVFNTPMNKGDSKSDGEVIRNTAILYGIPCFTRKENIRAVMEALIGTMNGHDKKLHPLALQDMKL